MVTRNESKTIPAGQFKARCLSLIDQVSQTHQVIIITKRGKPVARLVPLEEEKPRSLFGFFAGHVVEEGDIVSPTGSAADKGRAHTPLRGPGPSPGARGIRKMNPMLNRSELLHELDRSYSRFIAEI